MNADHDRCTTNLSPIPPNSREKKCKKSRKVWAKFSKERILLFSRKKGAAFPVKDCTRFVCTAVLHGTTNIRAKANFRLKGFEKL